MPLHSLRKCCWLRKSGDVMCSDYDKDAHHELNSHVSMHTFLEFT